MSRGQRWLLGGGLVLVTAGLLFGLLYGWLVGHGTLLVLKDSYGAAVQAAAERNAAGMQAGLKSGQKANYKLVRAVDVHTHLIKMGTVLLLAGLLWPLAGNGKSWRLAGALIASAVIFPLGVFLEIYTHSRIAQGVAGLGAGLTILIFAGMCWKLLFPDPHPPK